MRREAEFRAFLTKNNKSLDYINYCERVEKAFGGKDMDEIVRSYRTYPKRARN